MKIKYLILFLTCLLLLSGFTATAIACCEGPPPGECYVCEDTVWVQYGDCWGDCPTCESCVDCYCDCIAECGCEGKTCPTCESCVACSCECTAECGCEGKTCSSCCDCENCSCVGNDSRCDEDKCEFCAAPCTCIDRCPMIDEYCDGAGNCVECLTDADCKRGDHYGCGCEDHECEDCWEFSTVPSNEVEPCPECSNAMGGCYSTHIRIPNEYAVYLANRLDPPGPDQIGVCGRHYKTERVRFLATCVERQTDAQKIADLVNYLIGLGFDVSSIVGCTQCAGGNLSACPGCFAGLIVSVIWDEIFGKCFFVEECERCYWEDETCSYPLATSCVVDWETVDVCLLYE